MLWNPWIPICLVEQISRLGIGLLPVDGAEMVIDRERLESFIISRGQKSSMLIRWIGPASIRVCYGRAAGGLNQQLVPSSASGAKPAGLSVSDILRASATAPGGSSKTCGGRRNQNFQSSNLTVNCW